MTFQDPAEAFAESIRRLQAQADGVLRPSRPLKPGKEIFYVLRHRDPVMLEGIPNFLSRNFWKIFFLDLPECF